MPNTMHNPQHTSFHSIKCDEGWYRAFPKQEWARVLSARKKGVFNSIFPLINALLSGETSKDRTPQHSIAILLIYVLSSLSRLTWRLNMTIFTLWRVMNCGVAGMPVGSLAGFLNVGFQGVSWFQDSCCEFWPGFAPSGNWFASCWTLRWFTFLRRCFNGMRQGVHWTDNSRLQGVNIWFIFFILYKYDVGIGKPRWLQWQPAMIQWLLRFVMQWNQMILVPT